MPTSSPCARCGAPMTPESRPGGLCPRCLLEAGLADPGEAVVTSAGRRSAAAPPIETLAPHFPGLSIEELVGQGGMGAVYRVRQTKLSRDAALKILTVDLHDDPDFAHRFRREARALAGLSHPSIVTVYDYGQVGTWWFILMEYVDGATVRQMLRAKEVQPRQALSIVGQVCDALQYAHDQGVVHRDIKPENILVTREGRVKILDFGLAKVVAGDGGPGHLTLSGQAMGTPHYMAPEQWERPGEVDHRADIYSLGVVFYELLTGELPVGRFPLPSQRIGVDARLDEVVLKSLEKEPARRYQHVSEVKLDAERAGAHAPQAAPRRPAGVTVASAGPDRKERKRKGKSSAAVWVLVVCAVLLLPCVVLPLLYFGGSMVARQRAVADHAMMEARRAEADALEAMLAETGGTLVREESFHTNTDQVAAWVRPASLPELPDWGPQLDEESALAIGLDADEAAELREVLADYRGRYLELEREHMRLGWTEKGRLVVEIDAFPAARLELDRSLDRELGGILPSVALRPMLDGALQVERHFQSGRQPRTVTLWRAQDGFHIEDVTHFGNGGSTSTTEVAPNFSLPVDLQRLWEAGLAVSDTVELAALLDDAWGLLSPEVLEEYNLIPETRRSVEEALQAAEASYLALEATHTTSDVDQEGRLRLEIERFPDERRELLAHLRAEIRTATGNASWTEGFLERVDPERQFAHGSLRTVLHLWTEDGAFHVLEELPDADVSVQTSTPGLEPPPAVARFWRD